MNKQQFIEDIKNECDRLIALYPQVIGGDDWFLSQRDSARIALHDIITNCLMIPDKNKITSHEICTLISLFTGLNVFFKHHREVSDDVARARTWRAIILFVGIQMLEDDGYIQTLITRLEKEEGNE